METNEITEKVIGCAIRVSNTLGTGFLEKVYENALALELQNTGLAFEQQHPIQVRYQGTVVGDFAADMVIERQVIVELKAVRMLDPAHEAQVLNYLRATGIRVGLLLNFGTPKLEIKRFML